MLVKKTFKKSDFVSDFKWRQFCEDLGLDPIAQEIEIAILKKECCSN